MTRLILFLITFIYFQSREVKGEVDSLQALKDYVKEELKHVRENEYQLNNKIAILEKENEDKGRQLRRLEEELKLLKKERELNQRTRRQLRTSIAFTAYQTRHIHSLTKDQTIVYDHIWQVFTNSYPDPRGSELFEKDLYMLTKVYLKLGEKMLIEKKNVLLNDGNAYDNSTGVFTAPISGVYLFSYSIGSKAIPQVNLTQYDVFTRLVINGVHQLSAVAESTAFHDDEQGCTTAILFVLEGDKVWIIQEAVGGSNLYSNKFERITSFTGTLLYEKQVDGSIIG